ncbi:hypothetical protein [Croceitalea rosinachiae]|uniref:Chloroplast import component protein (Tic20) n=1 Tax=Croceitalea rosinachiae TaxID=3075596 RepID=A0ABU3AB57_9FLAO|nr:hypothetical protein [Croceitalea sp. F388]MDT0607422.1 hypothetical protein [Croceitalea sp. F388]
MTKDDVTAGKTAAIVAYLTIVGSLIAITMNLEPKNAFARFHIRQAFGIHLFFHALAIGLTFTGIAYASLVLFLLYLFLWGFGFMQALNGNKKEIPIVGSYFQKWFTFIS